MRSCVLQVYSLIWEVGARSDQYRAEATNRGEWSQKQKMAFFKDLSEVPPGVDRLYLPPLEHSIGHKVQHDIISHHMFRTGRFGPVKRKYNSLSQTGISSTERRLGQETP